MSGKQAKKARKIIKNYLKDMDTQNKVQFSFQQLKTFVDLSSFLTGKKPEKIELVEEYYNWYMQEIMAQAEALGLDTKLKSDKPTFMGIPLEKKVKIVVPEVVVPPAVAKDLPKSN
jgi:hypothetical protein